MTLKDAQYRILEYGTPYIVVFALLESEDDRFALKEWYLHEKKVPNLKTRGATGGPSMNGCRRCGGLMVRTGTCETCQSCGESNGGCG